MIRIRFAVSAMLLSLGLVAIGAANLQADDKAKKEPDAQTASRFDQAIADAEEKAQQAERSLGWRWDLSRPLAPWPPPGERLAEKSPPVLANIRGQVNRVLDDQIELTIGIDAGLAVGTVLEVYRVDGGSQYLGTVKVTSAANLFPKQAIVTFTPARNVPLERLKPEEFPRKGDRVRSPGIPSRKD